VISLLYSFHGADGAYPDGTLINGSDGNLYGTTHNGGTSSGTIFVITLGGALTTLHSFRGPDGAEPFAGLVLGSVIFAR
jgi:uncharacterized repeat protein (TIGR03803 family)